MNDCIVIIDASDGFGYHRSVFIDKSVADDFGLQDGQYVDRITILSAITRNAELLLESLDAIEQANTDERHPTI